MAKAKKRIPAQKKSSKRKKATAKATHKMAAKKVTSKKAKSKVQRTRKRAKKPAAKEMRLAETVERREVVEMPTETTIIDVIEEPAPGVVAVSEYVSVQTTTSISPVGEREHDEAVGPASTPT